MSPDDDDDMTPAAVARSLRTSVEHVRRLIRTGKLRAHDISASNGRPTWRIKRVDFVEFRDIWQDGGRRRLQRGEPFDRRSRKRGPYRKVKTES